MIKSNLNQTGVITTAGLDPTNRISGSLSPTGIILTAGLDPTNRISGSLSPTGIILSTIQIVVFDPIIVASGTFWEYTHPLERRRAKYI